MARKFASSIKTTLYEAVLYNGDTKILSLGLFRKNTKHQLFKAMLVNGPEILACTEDHGAFVWNSQKKMYEAGPYSIFYASETKPR